MLSYVTKWKSVLIEGATSLLLIACATDGSSIREKQDITFSVIGMSVLPIPSGLALGYRLSESNTIEWENAGDILTLNSYSALYNRHYWGNWYINTGVSASRSLMRNQDPYRAGLHLALGREFYYTPRFLGGFEFATADYGFYKAEGKWEEGAGGNLLRFYLGWGW